MGSFDGVETLEGLVLDGIGNAIVIGTSTGDQSVTSQRRHRHLSQEEQFERKLALLDNLFETFTVQVDQATGAIETPFVNAISGSGNVVDSGPTNDPHPGTEGEEEKSEKDAAEQDQQ